MRRSAIWMALCAMVPAQQPSPAPATASLVAASTATRPVELAICLDISGSMNGLIHQARQNLWSVVNELATLQPTPTLRVALLTFGCSAHDPLQGWVKVETDFTTDLDLVSQRLFALTTNGGEEYVGRVMQTALEQLQWGKGGDALRLLFVAGNESAAQDKQVDALAQSKAAIARGIVVNSIYCGGPQDPVAAEWREVAKLADGQFAAIDKDSEVVIATPFDEQLATLSVALNATYVPYGAQRQQWAENQRAQDGNAAGLNSAAAATRCQTKASSFYLNSHWDLVDACDDPKFRLADVKKEELPEALRAMSLEQLQAHIAAQKQQRGEIRGKVEALGKERDSFVAAARKKLGEAGNSLFEKVVLEAVRQQAEARGFRRKAPAAEPASSLRQDVDSPFAPLIRAAARDYRTFVRVTGEPQMAPSDCRMPIPNVLRSAAEREHGEKLYLLYARFADGLQYVKAGEPEKVGQTLVKEAWQCVVGEPSKPTEASRRYAGVLRYREGENVHHAGDSAGLFVMHKLAADTQGTDQGWVYGTVDRDGFVTAAGQVASCIRCHEGASADRRFGLR